MEPPPGRDYFVHIIVLSTAFFCFLGCYMAGQSYLTSTRSEGYFALAALYFAFSISSAFADQIVARIGTKVSLTVAPQFYALFILCCGISFFSDSTAVHYALLVTPGIGLGAAGTATLPRIAHRSFVFHLPISWTAPHLINAIFPVQFVSTAAILWTAQGIFLTNRAHKYAAANQLPAAEALGLFNGIFFAAVQAANIVSNAVASVLVKSAHLAYSSLYLGLGAVASVGALIFCALPDISPLEIREMRSKSSSGTAASSATDSSSSPLTDPISSASSSVNGAAEAAHGTSVLSFLRGAYAATIWPLLPLMMAQGMFQGFTWGLFPEKVISVALGKDYVGYVSSAAAFADMLGCLAFGRLTNVFGSVPIVVFGVALNTTACVLLFLYRGSIGDFSYAVVFAFGIVFGIVDAILNVQLPAMIAEYFSSSLDSAFSVYKLMQSMGSLFSFFLSPLLSFEANILAVTIYLFAAMLSLLRLHATRSAASAGYGCRANYMHSSEQKRVIRMLLEIQNIFLRCFILITSDSRRTHWPASRENCTIRSPTARVTFEINP